MLKFSKYLNNPKIDFSHFLVSDFASALKHYKMVDNWSLVEQTHEIQTLIKKLIFFTDVP